MAYIEHEPIFGDISQRGYALPPDRMEQVRASTITLDHQPLHPVVAMQAAFEESILESMERPKSMDKAREKDFADPKVRRQRLLEADDYNAATYNLKWRRKPGSRHHPLLKILAQIAFGIHLLREGLAKSDEEVVKILQAHVDEVDTFLERTTEDLDLATTDIKERINYLKLPLEHVGVFDAMLDDRKFRMSILDGNEKIEKIVERTAAAMNDALLDVGSGIEATSELELYLDRIGIAWARGNTDLIAIYNAMRGNTEGWFRCFRGLQVKGNGLGIQLIQLGGIVNEMSKRAGVASRRSIIATRSSRHTPRVASPPPLSRYAMSPIPVERSQPKEPSSAKVSFSPRMMSPLDAHPVDKRFENPRKTPGHPPQRLSAVAENPMGPPTASRQSSMLSKRASSLRSGFQRARSSISSQGSSALLPVRLDDGRARSPLSSPVPRETLNIPQQKPRKPPSPMANDSAYSTGSSNSDRTHNQLEALPTEHPEQSSHFDNVEDEEPRERSFSRASLRNGRASRLLSVLPHSTPATPTTLQPEYGVLKDCRSYSSLSSSLAATDRSTSRQSMRRRSSLKSLGRMLSWRRTSKRSDEQHQHRAGRPLSGVMEVLEPKS